MRVIISLSRPSSPILQRPVIYDFVPLSCFLLILLSCLFCSQAQSPRLSYRGLTYDCSLGSMVQSLGISKVSFSGLRLSVGTGLYGSCRRPGQDRRHLDLRWTVQNMRTAYQLAPQECLITSSVSVTAPQLSPTVPVGTAQFSYRLLPDQIHVRITVTPKPSGRFTFQQSARTLFSTLCSLSDYQALSGGTMEVNMLDGDCRWNLFPPDTELNLKTWDMNCQYLRDFSIVASKHHLTVQADKDTALHVIRYAHSMCFYAAALNPDRKQSPQPIPWNKPISFGFTMLMHTMQP